MRSACLQAPQPFGILSVRARPFLPLVSFLGGRGRRNPGLRRPRHLRQRNLRGRQYGRTDRRRPSQAAVHSVLPGRDALDPLGVGPGGGGRLTTVHVTVSAHVNRKGIWAFLHIVLQCGCPAHWGEVSLPAHRALWQGRPLQRQGLLNLVCALLLVVPCWRARSHV